MAFKTLVFSLLLGLVTVSVTSGAEIAPQTVVGSVLGSPITAAQVKLTQLPEIEQPFDARDKEKWDIMGRIGGAFSAPLIKRFVEEHQLSATADEIQEFHNFSQRQNERRIVEGHAEVKALEVKLTSPDLSDAERTKLTKKLALHRRILKHSDELLTKKPHDAIAKDFITRWKTERELQRTYGGRVLFQQFGLEAFDARREYYEEAEQKGDLTFAEPTVRRLFYYYFAEL
jgi:hypothetical protein